MTYRLTDLEAHRARPLLVRLAKEMGIVAREISADEALAALRVCLDACDGTATPRATAVGRMDGLS